MSKGSPRWGFLGYRIDPVPRVAGAPTTYGSSGLTLAVRAGLPPYWSDLASKRVPFWIHRLGGVQASKNAMGTQKGIG